MLTEETLVSILIDVTEQPTQKPKKRHTLKTEIILKENGKILPISRTAKGRKYDFPIRKEGKPLPGKTKKFVDLSYQGLQKICSHVQLPFRRKRNIGLSKEQRQHNPEHNSFRSRIENKIWHLKIFKILSETYRNFQRKQRY